MKTTDTSKIAHARMGTLEGDLYAKVLNDKDRQVCIIINTTLHNNFVVDIDECSTGLNNCSHNNADCNNTDGSFECRCKAGYIGDGVICISECIKNIGGIIASVLCILHNVVDSTKVFPGPCNNSQSYCECASMSDCGCRSGFEMVDVEGSKVCRGKQHFISIWS